MKGYASPEYAESLSELGVPRRLHRSQTHVLERHIPDSPYYDAMGCYPLFACEDWSRLDEDIQDLGKQLVSLTVVTDPFGNYDPPLLEQCFGDLVVPFKEHFVTDLRVAAGQFISKHHRYYARRASTKVNVEKCREPELFLDVWLSLYGNLIQKHGLEGIQTFSRRAFAQQLTAPGIVVFRATYGEYVVGAHLWFVRGDVAYSHLAASSPLGYDLMVSYALYQAAIEYFSPRVRWLDLGSGAGMREDSSGLSRFKRGWSTGRRTAYLCGKIFDREKYEDLVSSRDKRESSYFPAYRDRELG